MPKLKYAKILYSQKNETAMLSISDCGFKREKYIVIGEKTFACKQCKTKYPGI